jgi:glycosyltransferase involved in cell wall biosynthesis
VSEAQISVVITAYNEEDFVGIALRSALRQTRSDLEIIVVDDGSGDRTVDVVNSFDDERIRLISQENQGLSAARNTGIAASSCPLVAFLDSDDLWMPEFCEQMAAALESRPGAGFSYSDAWWLDDSTDRFYRASAMSVNQPPEDPPADPEEFLRLLLTRGNFIFVSTMVRRTVLDEVGGFDTTLTAVEDYDMWIRILEAGHGAVATGRRLALKRDRGTSMSRQHRNMFVNLRRVLAETADNRNVPDDAKAAARARIASLDRAIAAVDGEAPLQSALGALRSRAGRARKAVLAGRIYHDGVPEEVATAFPDSDWRLGAGARG